jgi:DNA-binding transcriptional LysR family regulator
VNRIEDLQAFVAVVEKGSLTGAARHLGRSLQAVSRSLATMEETVGVELVRRTTRRSAPTEAGLAFHARIKPALAEIAEATQEVTNRRIEPSGMLRLSGSTAFAPLYLVPAVAAFLSAYPKVKVELDVSDRFVDLVAEGIDIAIRLGEMADSTLRVRRLANLRRVYFAAPSYLAKHGRPKRPEDLAHHRCVIRTAASDAEAWPFTVYGRKKVVKVTGHFRAGSAAAVNEAAVHGLGVGTAPLWQIRSMVDQGSVELLLTRFEPSPVPVHAVWPATRILPSKVKLFVDLLADRLKREKI